MLFKQILESDSTLLRRFNCQAVCLGDRPSQFLIRLASRAFAVLTTALLLTQVAVSAPIAGQETVSNGDAAARPNILWLSVEDIGPQLGCYGDSVANTPSIDALAKRGVAYDFAWSNYPVCAPARTTIITGMYAASNAAGNMRSVSMMPKGIEMFPHYLRQAGYYCTNNSKEDYNLARNGNEPWDESSKKAHYRNRAQGQPFFAVFNYVGTHESKIRVRPHTAVTDPAKVLLPSYWPDVPEVRQDFAQYYDNIAKLDQWVAKHLQALEESGVAENTIVVFFGDHGSGMPRHKRYAGDSGMRVPLIVHIPQQLEHLAAPEFSDSSLDTDVGKHSQRLVSFIDLAPTVLSIAGVEPPAYLQGSAFLGKYQTESPEYLYGFRDRMDERPDTSRSLRDKQFCYIRNFLPELPAGQVLAYQQLTPATVAWQQLFNDGKLNEVQAAFWKPRVAEELYDLEADPDETKNLIDDPKLAEVAARFRAEYRASYRRFGDLGLIPEPIAFDFAAGLRPRVEMVQNTEAYPLDRILDVACLAAELDASNVNELLDASRHDSATVRYWAAVGLRALGDRQDNSSATFAQVNARLVELMSDRSTTVGLVAAESLSRIGQPVVRDAAIGKLLQLADYRESNPYDALLALNAIDHLPAISSEIGDTVSKLPVKVEQRSRGTEAIKTLKTRIVERASSRASQ